MNTVKIVLVGISLFGIQRLNAFHVVGRRYPGTSGVAAVDSLQLCPTRAPFIGGRSYPSEESGQSKNEEVASPTFLLSSFLRGNDEQAWTSGNSALQNEVVLKAKQMSAADRQNAGAEWAQRALTEHASVASFGKMIVDLMAIGAPPRLLERAFRAGLDEIRHAQVSFEIAEALSPQFSRGFPGKFPAHWINVTQDGEKIAIPTALYGAIDETMSSVIEKFQSKLVEKEMPALSRVLLNISNDEARHAALAWQTLAWLKSQNDSAVVFSLDWWQNRERLFSQKCVWSDGSFEKTVSVDTIGTLRDCIKDFLGYHTYKNLVMKLAQGLIENTLFPDTIRNLIEKFVGNTSKYTIVTCATGQEEEN